VGISRGQMVLKLLRQGTAMEQGGAVVFRVGALEEGRRETGSACPYLNLEEKFLIFKITYNLRILQLYAVLRIRFRDPMPFWPLDPDPGSGKGLFRIPNPYFGEVSDKFLGKEFYNSLKTGSNFFSSAFQNKIIFNFVKILATKKDMTTNIFSPFYFIAVLGFGIRDPRSEMGKNQDPG
jgi:hypothetical protein